MSSSKNRLFRWLIGSVGGAFCFLLGLVFQPILLPSILPWTEPLGVTLSGWLNGPPRSVWRTDRVGGCIAGDVGLRAEAARRDGVLLQIGRYTDQVWVCGDHAFDESNLIERFSAIADRYPSCFGFNNEGKRWLGVSWEWLGQTNRRFWVDPASPAVCSTGLYQPEGERRFIETDHVESRLICMGDAPFDYVVQDDRPQNSAHPEPCGDIEMRRYGFDTLLN